MPDDVDAKSSKLRSLSKDESGEMNSNFSVTNNRKNLNKTRLVKVLTTELEGVHTSPTSIQLVLLPRTQTVVATSTYGRCIGENSGRIPGDERFIQNGTYI